MADPFAAGVGGAEGAERGGGPLITERRPRTRARILPKFDMTTSSRGLRSLADVGHLAAVEYASRYLNGQSRWILNPGPSTPRQPPVSPRQRPEGATVRAKRTIRVANLP